MNSEWNVLQNGTYFSTCRPIALYGHYLTHDKKNLTLELVDAIDSRTKGTTVNRRVFCMQQTCSCENETRSTALFHHSSDKGMNLPCSFSTERNKIKQIALGFRVLR
jgi:hypothetical protein